MGVVDIIIRKRGTEWAKQVCGMTEAKTAEDVARFVYEDFRDSPEGQRAWAQDDSDAKADDIFDEIYNRDVIDGEMIADEEWESISDALYTMIYEGVF